MVLLFACRWQLRHLGDFAGQCRYAYDNGATMNDVVKVVTYVTDVRNLPGRESAAQKRWVGLRSPCTPS
jgi:enamine deaminase RidA (YjgF/YER057c/UK114 family)